ncbi:DUF4432 family protein [Ensifer soli]|uniref:DUF4432 family protein n=1 Tax=Ciceribacter sp. sgz301302 TaxID=3342379 RepID=UPI0035B9A436
MTDLRTMRRLANDLAQFADIDLVSGEDGPARGARFLIGRTIAGLHFRIAVDRGLDIADLDYRGQPLGWHSPTGLTAPGLHGTDGEGGLSFLRGFSGFLVTCGWDHYGPAREGPADHHRYALRERQDYPLHGRAHAVPARLLSYGVETEGEPVIRIRGRLRQFSLFAEGYDVIRTITIPVFEPKVTLEDQVTHIGRNRSPHRVLYHVNLAYPLVDDGTTIDGVPADPHMPTPMPPLSDDEVERFKCIPRSEWADTITVGQAAEKGGLSLAITMDSPHFTHLVQWWNRFPGANMIGIEPASAMMPGLASEGDFHPDAWMEPGESRTYRLVFDMGGGA